MSKSKVTKSPVKSAPQTPTMIHEHIDNFLAKISGETPVDDKPRNSKEFWLNEIAKNMPANVIANPETAGTESDLTALQVGDTKYLIPVTEVIANPETTGTEEDLTALQVGNTKYLIPSGGAVYKHIVRIRTSNTSSRVVIVFYSTTSTPFESISDIATALPTPNNYVVVDAFDGTGLCSVMCASVQSTHIAFNAFRWSDSSTNSMDCNTFVSDTVTAI